ncbi:MAG: hypothetical protein AAFR17_03180 [Pseudomonadota bacterium]
MNQDPFFISKQTLSWGRENLEEFEQIVGAYFRSNPYAKIKEIDSKTGEEVVKYIPRTQFPLGRASRKATEAIQHIKNAFDQMTFAACMSVNPKLENETIYFPWTDTPAGFKARFDGSRLKLSEELRPVFESLKPYARGDGCTPDDNIARKLAQISNQKHTVGITLSPQISGVMVNLSATNVKGPVSVPQPRWNPVKNEIEVRRGAPQANFDENYEFYVDVVFDKSTTLQGTPVRKGISIFLAKAEKALETLRDATKG